MNYRLMCGGDLHKRMKDLTTIHGYINANTQVQLDVMQALKDNNCTHFIGLGDWFDRGYGTDVTAALVHTDLDRRMAEQINGNFYGLVGNHIRIRMDSNPELFLIQPHKVFTSRHKVLRKEQIIKTPNSLVLNGVQIIFMHYNHMAESARDYKPMIDKSCHYHIALFHTPYIIPSDRLHGMHMEEQSSSNTIISAALEDVELAIVGDIHKPLGTFTINRLDGGSTTMIVPGSLTNTDAGLGSRHEYIDMPIIDIDEDGAVSLSYHRQSLHTELLTFLKKEVPDDVKEKLKSLRGNSKETLYNELESMSFVGESNVFLSLNSFIKEQGYTQGDKKLIKSVIHNPTDIDELVKIYKADTYVDVE